VQRQCQWIEGAAGAQGARTHGWCKSLRLLSFRLTIAASEGHARDFRPAMSG